MMGFADIQADEVFSLFAIAWIRTDLSLSGRYNPAFGPLVGGPVVNERKMMSAMLADVACEMTL